MIKRIFYVFFLASQTMYCVAQDQQSFMAENQVVYKIQFKPDSTNQDNVITEYAELLTNKNGSIFRTISQGRIDSAINAQFLVGNRMEIKTAERTQLNFTIVKQKDSVYTYDVLYNSFAFFARYGESKNTMQWSIEKDTLTHNGIRCQKAQLTYGGRNWIAWFSMGIPLQDGPYKFGGLPGLIVYLYDSANQWVFDLANINPKFSKQVFYGDPRMEYKQMSKSAFFRERKRLKDNVFELTSAMGLNDRLSSEQLIKLKEIYKKKVQKENNGIEIYD